MRYFGRGGTVFKRNLGRNKTVLWVIAVGTEQSLWGNSAEAERFKRKLQYLPSQPSHLTKTVLSGPRYLINISLDYPIKGIMQEKYIYLFFQYFRISRFCKPLGRVSWVSDTYKGWCVNLFRISKNLMNIFIFSQLTNVH